MYYYTATASASIAMCCHLVKSVTNCVAKLPARLKALLEYLRFIQSMLVFFVRGDLLVKTTPEELSKQTF
jgi:hypothetical protein